MYEIKEIKDDLINIYKNGISKKDEYINLLNIFTTIIENTTFNSKEKKIDFFLFYSFLEDYWYKYSFLLNNENYIKIKKSIEEIKIIMSKFAKETGILKDRKKLNDMRRSYFTTDFSKENKKTEKEEEVPDQSTILGEKEILPEENKIYKCINNRIVKNNDNNKHYLKFKKGNLYKVIKIYKDKKTNKHHIILYDVYGNKIDSHLYHFNKHFDLKNNYNENEIIEENIYSPLPPVGFVDELKEIYN